MAEEAPYFASNGTIYQRGEVTRTQDGRNKMSMHIPVLSVHEAVADPDTAARWFCDMINKAEAQDTKRPST